MRIHFQERPWDLYIALGYTAVLSTALVVLGDGQPAAVLLVLLVPGYVLLAALLPSNQGFGWLERLVLSVGLSLAVVPLLLFALNSSPFGTGLVPVVLVISAFTTLAGIVAYSRRMRLPTEERLAVTIDLPGPTWREFGEHDKTLTVLLTSAIIISAGAVASVLMTPSPVKRTTGFFILGPTGNASGYPTALNISQPGTVLLSIANHEAGSANYAVRVDLVGVKVVHNATTDADEAVELNRTAWSWFNVSLADSQIWKYSYTFSIQEIGLWKVQFLLFKDGDFSSAYRELHLYVTVA